VAEAASCTLAAAKISPEGVIEREWPQKARPASAAAEALRAWAQKTRKKRGEVCESQASN
jgi:hypothetical protein